MTDPLLAQFLEEGAELLDDVERGLLALERNPDDRELINEVFRAAHTFKGASGLFEFRALTFLTHAAEDVLDAVRDASLVPGPDVIDALTAAFDVGGAWLGDIRERETLPEDADVVAASHVAALRALLGTTLGDGDASTEATPLKAPAPEWLTELDVELLVRADDARRGGKTVHAVRYYPNAGCFFRGEDPLLLVRQVPDLLALVIAPRRPWPPLDELDEFDCLLCFTLLTTTPAKELEHLFRYVVDEVEIVVCDEPAGTQGAGTLGVGTQGAGPPGAGPALDGVVLPAPIALLVAAQRQMLAAPFSPDQLPGRLSSAVTVLRGALSAAGIETDALTRAADAASNAGHVAPLQAFLDGLLPGKIVASARPPTAAAPPALVPVPVPDGSPNEGVAAVGVRALKVDHAKIDRILELAGELVVAKNALPFLARAAEEEYGLLDLSRQIKDQYGILNRLAEEMQHAVMDIRMLPVSVAFQRFPRLVRDLARKLDKQVRLVTEGEDTAADKDVLELIGEPLLHLVRNSLDHGIERPADRVAAGKPAEATLRLTASQEADAVVVHVHDDGRGIDPRIVRQKAYASGLIDEARLESLSDRETLELLFLPGLSTAEKISDLSGRGVGLDVVRSTVRRLGGDVWIESRLGRGTTIRLRLPLTMAITRIMTVSAGGQLFGIALDHVRETVRIRRADLSAILNESAIVLRDHIVPIVDLRRTLEISDGNSDQGDLAVLVVRPSGEDVGLVVDRFHESIDVVLKPMEGVLAGARQYGGTALLGDGQVLLVLNLKELISDGTQAR